MQLTRKKLLKYGLSALLIAGVIVALGFLSFTGMLALCGIVGCAIASFALTGMIEGEVYAQNVLRGVEKLFKGKWWDNKYLKHAIYIRELNKLLKEQENIDASKFLQEYSARLKAFGELQSEKEKLGLLYFASGEFKKKFEMTEKLLQEEQKYFIDFMEGRVSEDDDPILEGMNGIVTRPLKSSNNEPQNLKDKISEEFKLKHAISPWCLGAGVFAGVGMGLVFFSVAPESIVATAAFFGVALSASAFPVGITVAIIILSAMAAVGYAVLVYNTLTDMLQHDAVKKWGKGIKKFFSTQGKEVTAEFVAKRVFGALGVALLVAVCVFATITTAGTWWYAAKAGATFILPQLERLVEIFSSPLVVVMGIGLLGFNLYNSLKTLSIVKHFSLAILKEKLSQALKKYLGDPKNENSIQNFNLFRWIVLVIAIPFEVLVFLGHVISSAVMGDRFEGIPIGLCVGPSAANEFTADLTFFVDEPHGESHKPKEGEVKLIEGSELSDKKKKAHVHGGEEHDHSHTDIPGKVLLVILSPVYFLSALWDFGWSHLNEDEKHQLSFGDALIKSFFGFEAYKIFSGQKDIKDEVEDSDLKAPTRDNNAENMENMKRTLSIHKISKLLDSDKLNENEKEFFQKLKEDLRPGDAVYADVFKNVEGNAPTESAQAFLAKVRLS